MDVPDDHWKAVDPESGFSWQDPDNAAAAVFLRHGYNMMRGSELRVNGYSESGIGCVGGGKTGDRHQDNNRNKGSRDNAGLRCHRSGRCGLLMRL